LGRDIGYKRYGLTLVIFVI